MDKINLAEKLALFNTHWDPKIVGELNGQQVKLVKFQGTFVWHQHEREDELFLVVKGEFDMEFRDRRVTLKEGELIIVPRAARCRAPSGGGAGSACAALRARLDAQHRQRAGRVHRGQSRATITPGAAPHVDDTAVG